MSASNYRMNYEVDHKYIDKYIYYLLEIEFHQTILNSPFLYNLQQGFNFQKKEEGKAEA